MIAEVTVHIDRVLDIVVIEGDSGIADRRYKRILHQTDMVIIDIYIREHLLEEGIENFSCLDDLSDTVALLTLDNILLTLRVFAVDMLRHGLVHLERQDLLVVER